MNKSAKGNYYELKTKKWYESQGYAVESIKKTYRIMDKKRDKIVFIKRDLWGGDLVACKRGRELNIATIKGEMIWIQVKSNKNHIAQGLKELEKSPLPGFVRKIVVYCRDGNLNPSVLLGY